MCLAGLGDHASYLHCVFSTPPSLCDLKNTKMSCQHDGVGWKCMLGWVCPKTGKGKSVIPIGCVEHWTCMLGWVCPKTGRGGSLRREVRTVDNDSQC